MANTSQNDKVRKRHYFHNTMTDLLEACFCNADKNCLKEEDAISFFLYIMKYNKNTDFLSQVPDPLETLRVTLSSKGSRTNTPEISILLDFLHLHILNIDSETTRNSSYYDKSGNVYVQKTYAELIEYCKDNLGLEFKNEKVLTSDFLIDIITICFVIGRHLLPNPSRPLDKLFPSISKTTLLSSLHEKKAHFTVIHGHIGQYMIQYVKNQLHNISYNISHESYRSNWIPETTITPQWESKYPEIMPQLSQAILNAYLLQDKEHYLIIHGIPTQDALNNLIDSCRLYKNIILVCNFDIDSVEGNDSISYLAFQDFYQEPLPIDIKTYFGKGFTPTDELCNALLTVSKRDLSILCTLLILVKNLSKSKDTEWETTFKNNLDTLSLEADVPTLPTTKYNMSDMNKGGRTRNNLNGHIRRLYKTILSADEWLLVLLIALHGENGMPEEVLSKILQQNADGIITSLIDKHLIYKEGTFFIYNGSLLIPYALLYGKQNLDDSSSLFLDLIAFLKFMVEEICYYNSKPIDYDILCITLKKTYKAVFTLLHKSKEYDKHFAEIWYYHIRYTNFLFENGDIDGLNELEENFQSLAEKLMLRPGEENRQWKKLYKIYDDFHKLRIEAVDTPPASLESHASLIQKLISQIEHYVPQPIAQVEYLKLLLYLLKINIYYLFHLCISGLRKCYFSCIKNNAEPYIENLKMILVASLKSRETSDKLIMLNDKPFLPEMTNAFNTIIKIAAIYLINDNCGGLGPIEAIPLQKLFTLPRYMQLSWFQIYCAQLSKQCRSRYIFMDSSKTLQVAEIKCTITKMYQKLDLIPLYILEDYYYALIICTLTIAPLDIKKLLLYLKQDLERYKHIWQYSRILSRINNTISGLEHSPNLNA